jgi:hypothetical protein
MKILRKKLNLMLLCCTSCLLIKECYSGDFYGEYEQEEYEQYEDQQSEPITPLNINIAVFGQETFFGVTVDSTQSIEEGLAFLKTYVKIKMGLIFYMGQKVEPYYTFEDIDFQNGDILSISALKYNNAQVQTVMEWSACQEALRDACLYSFRNNCIFPTPCFCIDTYIPPPLDQPSEEPFPTNWEASLGAELYRQKSAIYSNGKTFPVWIGIGAPR